MREPGDIELLRQYAREGSEQAFEKLMAGHVNLVYSVALRKTGNAHAAEEITQAVFIILAQKADALRRGTILSGWLYQTARLTAANYLRTEIRRFHREQEASVQSLDKETGPEVWPQMAPLLEDAMGRLGGKDRDAIVLRFMEGKHFREIGAAFGASENAAKKRVGRALEKLRKFLAKRGVVSTAAVIAGAISAQSVQAAPAGLVKTISAVAITKGAAAGGSISTLVKGALKLMAWTKAKTAIVVGVAAIMTVGTTSIVFLKNPAPFSDSFAFSQTEELTSDAEAKYASDAGSTPEQAARTFFEACGREDWVEVAKFWEPGTRYPLNDEAKNHLGGLQVVSLGKPFSAWTRDGKKFGGVFVPYIIRFKNGEVKRFRLQVRCDNPDKRWVVDGGL